MEYRITKVYTCAFQRRAGIRVFRKCRKKLAITPFFKNGIRHLTYGCWPISLNNVSVEVFKCIREDAWLQHLSSNNIQDPPTMSSFLTSLESPMCQPLWTDKMKSSTTAGYHVVFADFPEASYRVPHIPFLYELQSCRVVGNML